MDYPCKCGFCKQESDAPLFNLNPLDQRTFFPNTTTTITVTPQWVSPMDRVADALENIAEELGGIRKALGG
jgi:hypothetical protein